MPHPAAPQTKERLKRLKAIPRPDLAKAFQSAGDSALVLAVSPADDTRRALRESLPALPPELGGMTGAELADGFQSLTIAVDLPPRPSLSLTVQAADARAAAQLRSLAMDGLDLLTKDERVTRELLEQLALLVGEILGRPDRNMHVEIAIAATADAWQSLATQADHRAMLHPGGNRDLFLPGWGRHHRRGAECRLRE